MDKLDRNNTITIKINANEKAYKDELTKEIPNNQVKEEQVEQTQEFQSAIKETASSKEVEEESFNWVIPERIKQEPANNHEVQFSHESLNESSIFTVPSKNKKNRKLSSLPQLIVSIVVAIAIGGGFSFIVLKTITAKVDSVSSVQEGNVLPVTGDGISEQPNAAIIPEPFPVSVVQGGLFSNKEAAEKQRDIFRDNNMPAEVLSLQGKYYVVLFASDTVDNAKKISSSYKNKGLDAFWKELNINIKSKQLSEGEADFLKDTFAIYTDLTKIVSSRMLLQDEMESGHLQKQLTSLQSKNTESKQLKNLMDTLEKAVLSVNNSSEAVQSSLLVQESLLKYLVLLNESI